jgi:hypothetical protein
MFTELESKNIIYLTDLGQDPNFVFYRRKSERKKLSRVYELNAEQENARCCPHKPDQGGHTYVVKCCIFEAGCEVAIFRLGQPFYL